MPQAIMPQAIVKKSNSVTGSPQMRADPQPEYTVKDAEPEL